MNHKSLMVIAFLPLAAGAGKASAEELRLPITRDTWVSSYWQQGQDERSANLGGETRLKFKSFHELALVDVDPTPVRGRVILSAHLHLRQTGPEALLRLTVSSLTGEWEEGTGKGYRPQVGSASFLQAKQQQAWARGAGEYTDLTSVFAGEGGTIWSSSPVQGPDAQGWQTIAFDPAILAARAAGLSSGFVLMDDIGTEYLKEGDALKIRSFPNRFVSSREAGPAHAPYMTVHLGPEDHLPPAGIAQIRWENAALPRGQAELTWTTPGDDGPAGVLGFVGRWSPAEAAGQSFSWDKAQPIPPHLFSHAAPQDQLNRLRLRDLPWPADGKVTVGLRAVDAAGNPGPVATVTFTPSTLPEHLELPALSTPTTAPDAPLPQRGGVTLAVVPIWAKWYPDKGDFDPKDLGGSLQANPLWSAAQGKVRLYAGRNEAVNFQVILQGAPAKNIRASLHFTPPGPEGEAGPQPQTTWARLTTVGTMAGEWQDPLVPVPKRLEEGVIELAMNANQPQSLVGEVYVPAGVQPGRWRGRLEVKFDQEQVDFPVELTVWHFTLPDELTFVPQMNCYGKALPDSEKELDYYRLAHQHRTCLNRLPYNWQGQPGAGLAPRWDAQTQRFAWEAYDQRIGTLLDGSAFAHNRRAGIPVDAFYLPVNENWPIPIDGGWTDGTPGYWADDALTEAYRRQFIGAIRQWAEHFQQRGWRRTRGEFFLNGKLQFKGARWSAASSPWTLDEPLHVQDFIALRWFGRAFREGVNAARQGDPAAPAPALVFRADISRPQWQRDLLDEVLDVNVISGELPRYARLVQERQRRTGQTVLMYGGNNPVETSNLQPALWCLQAWCLGADGVVPWQTMGKGSSWSSPDAEALFYPGETVGLPGPIPSIRLKAYQAGQQLAEYLNLARTLGGVPRWQLAGTALAHCPLQWEAGARSADNANLPVLQGVSAWQWEQFRLRLGMYLDERARPGKN